MALYQGLSDRFPEMELNAMDADSLKVAGEAGVRYGVEVDNVAQQDGSWGALSLDQEYTVTKFGIILFLLSLFKNKE